MKYVSLEASESLGSGFDVFGTDGGREVPDTLELPEVIREMAQRLVERTSSAQGAEYSTGFRYTPDKKVDWSAGHVFKGSAPHIDKATQTIRARNSTLAQVARRLRQPDIDLHTHPPMDDMSMQQVVDTLAENATGLQRNPESYPDEGFLVPSTYDVRLFATGRLGKMAAMVASSGGNFVVVRRTLDRPDEAEADRRNYELSNVLLAAATLSKVEGLEPGQRSRLLIGATALAIDSHAAAYFSSDLGSSTLRRVDYETELSQVFQEISGSYDPRMIRLESLQRFVDHEPAAD